jgi:uncharacterized protein
MWATASSVRLGPNHDGRVDFCISELSADVSKCTTASVANVRLLSGVPVEHNANVRSSKMDALPLNRTEIAMTETRPPLPPFTAETAALKVRAAEDGWNSCDPERVSLAYSIDSYWRNRAEFVLGRSEIVAFLTRKWSHELEYRLIKELWAFTPNRIAVRFAYEWHDDRGDWFRSYGNENWEFDDNGLMRRRFACINDLPIVASDRKYRWDRSGPRPKDHPGLEELGL